VDVDDAARVLPDDVRGQHLHVAREHDEVGACFPDLGEQKASWAGLSADGNDSNRSSARSAIGRSTS
jgi:hypothetical protein